MSDRLPPLTALRAFDAAARHMSFAKAAAELNVTPAALSFQIKNLEEHLGTPVFHRMNRAVELTDAGRALAPGVADGFVTLAAAWRAAKRTGDSAALTVTAGPAFTAKWLAPRLFAFASAHPDIELRFTASLRLMDFDRDDVDVAIRFGLPREEPGLSMHVLSREWMTPMMTPEMAETYASPSDLAKRAAAVIERSRFPETRRRLVGMVSRRGPAAALLGGNAVQPGRSRAGCRGLGRGCGAGPDHACRTRSARGAARDALRHRPDDRGGLPRRVPAGRRKPPADPHLHRLAGAGGEGPGPPIRKA
jgi:DNA-binding transcriptional LysR family regulator